MILVVEGGLSPCISISFIRKEGRKRRNENTQASLAKLVALQLVNPEMQVPTPLGQIEYGYFVFSFTLVIIRVVHLMEHKGSLVNKRDLLALYLSVTYCHRTGTRPPSYITPQQPTMYAYVNIEIIRFLKSQNSRNLQICNFQISKHVAVITYYILVL